MFLCVNTALFAVYFNVYYNFCGGWHAFTSTALTMMWACPSVVQLPWLIVLPLYKKKIKYLKKKICFSVSVTRPIGHMLLFITCQHFLWLCDVPPSTHNTCKQYHLAHFKVYTTLYKPNEVLNIYILYDQIYFGLFTPVEVGISQFSKISLDSVAFQFPQTKWPKHTSSWPCPCAQSPSP